MKRRLHLVQSLFIGSALLAASLLPLRAIAQQQSEQPKQPPPQSQASQPSPPQPPPAKADSAARPQPGQKRDEDQSGKDQSQEKATSPKNDRLFGVLPNYLTVENQDKVPPLTAGGKFKLVSKNSFDPVIFPFYGFIALLGQAQNSEPDFGQGTSGFAKRYGAAIGDATIGSFMTGAVFPSLFKQDPRYYQLARGSFKRRMGYSLSRIFIARSDSGHPQFNSSEILGNLVAAGISNTYHPASDRSFANTLSVWGSDIGWDAVANVAQEFWPDIHRWLKRKFRSHS